MGDAGFDEQHLHQWRRAEAAIGIVNAAAKAGKKATTVRFRAMRSLASKAKKRPAAAAILHALRAMRSELREAPLRMMTA